MKIKEKNHSEHHKMMMEEFKKKFFISLLLTLPILILSPAIQQWFNFKIIFYGSQYILFLLASIIFFYGGMPFLKGFVKEMKNKTPGMMTLIALATSVAYIYSSAVVFGLKGKFFFWELATLIDVMLFGHWVEMKSIMSASTALEKLARLLPDKAHLIKGKEIVDVRINELKKGDIILIKPGEKIPSDGVVIRGRSYVDESMLTGESKPVLKEEGSIVIGGSINGDGSLEMKVKGVGEESYLARVIKLVRQAQETKSKTQRLADKAAFLLTIVAIIAGVSTLLAWLIYGKEAVFAIERMVTVMVITCPHALGLAIPLVVAISTAISAKNGLLIRNRTSFEKARKVTVAVFDKTGTLTEGKFSVDAIHSFDNDKDNFSDKEIISLAASLEKHSEHPIARAITEKAKEIGAELMEVEEFELIKGAGIKGKIEGKEIKAVGIGYLKDKGIDVPLESSSTTVFVLVNGKIAGAITLSDKIRKESYDAIKRLKKAGIKCWMLTGDNKEVAKKVSEELGLDGYFAEVLPHEKQEKIKELQGNNIVAMVGDGVNDAPALAQADVGIAIGSGVDIAAETADIVLVNSNPNDVATLIAFSNATYKKMVQNLVWATGYNVLAIPLAAGVLYSKGIIISPALGALLMSLSTVIVAINAKLMKLEKRE